MRTSTPNDALDVNGYTLFGPLTEKLSVGSASLGFNRKVANGAIFDNTHYAYQFQHMGSSTQGNDFLALQVYNPGGASVTSTVLTVNGFGNVGIGTSTLDSRLHIVGTGSSVAAGDLWRWSYRSSQYRIKINYNWCPDRISGYG